MIIEKNNITLNGMRQTVYGPGPNVNGIYGIRLSRVTNVTVENVKITNFEIGVYMDGSAYITLSNNEITGNYAGMYTTHSAEVTLTANDVFSNLEVGILLVDSQNFNLTHNSIWDNVYNFGVYSQSDTSFVHNIDISNTVNNKTMYYLVNRRNLLISPITHGQVGFLALVNCSYITVRDFTIMNNQDGLLLAQTNNSTIANNAFISDQYGIYLCNCKNNTFYGNTVNDCYTGVWFDSASNNTISRNKFIGNYWAAIELVFRRSSSYNRIYHNNFIDNGFGYPIRFQYSYPNFWDNGYPSGGNYWNDYNGTDLYSGPSQNVNGSDGIHDHAYNKCGSVCDYYPLVSLLDLDPPSTMSNCSYGWHNKDFTITLSAVDNNSSIADTYYRINNDSIRAVKEYGQPQIVTENDNGTLEYWSVDGHGNEENHHIIYNIQLDKTKPVAVATLPTTVNMNNSVVLDGSASSDNINVTSYTWYFTDSIAKTLTGKKVAYTFNSTGVHTITLRVTDPAGNWATDEINVTVLSAQTSPSEPFPMWVVVTATIVPLLIVPVTVTTWRKRKRKNLGFMTSHP
jgi:parallel beta-helix repeat protein